MSNKILGIHHLTAVSGPARETHEFYTQVLGLKLVKKTVNFDDPSVYHLYYGDEAGSPGTLLTFFPYGGPSGRPGAGQVTAFSYPVSDLEAWRGRLSRKFLEERRFQRNYLTFTDPHGLQVELFEEPGAGHPLTKFGGITLSLREVAATADLLEELGFQEGEQEGGRFRYSLPSSSEYIELQRASDGPRGLGGPGTFHHLALRVSGPAAQLEWRNRLLEQGYRVSPVMDRNYFRSIYFRGPGGVLFELATDPPGMAVDESLDELGKNLMLPSRYEPRRSEIEAALQPLEQF